MSWPQERYPDVVVSSGTQIDCGVMDGPFAVANRVVDLQPGQCADWQIRWREDAQTAHPQAAVVTLGTLDLYDRVAPEGRHSPGSPQYETALAEGLDNAIAAVRAGDEGATPTPVYLLGFPCYDAEVDREILTDRRRVDLANLAVEDYARGRASVTFVDLRGFTCDVDTAGRDVRKDGVRWSPVGAELVWEKLLGAIARSRLGLPSPTAPTTAGSPAPSEPSVPVPAPPAEAPSEAVAPISSGDAATGGQP
jgi:hypothetical protein